MNNVTNSVSLIGNCGSDVDFKELENGSKMAKVNLATNSYYRDSNGERIKKTQWHSLIGWNKTAELMTKLMRKGSKVAIEGELNHDTYTDSEGIVKYYTSVKVRGIETLSPKEENLPF